MRAKKNFLWAQSRNHLVYIFFFFSDKDGLKEYCIFNYIILIATFSIIIFLYGYFPVGHNEGIVATGKDIPQFVERTRQVFHKIELKKII